MTTETPDIQQQRESYDEIWGDLPESRYRAQQHLKNRIFAIRQLLADLKLDNPSILEIGCGFGVISREPSEFGRVTGMDLSPKGVEIANRLNPELEYFHGDVLSHDFDDAKYDVIVNSEVIEHVQGKNRERFIEVIAGLLSPEGYMILTTPNKQLSDSVSTFQLIEEHFTRDDLVSLLEPRFEIHHLTTVHRVFPILGYKFRTFQLMRAFLYEVLRLHRWIEDPFRNSDSGLYFAVLAQLRSNR